MHTLKLTKITLFVFLALSVFSVKGQSVSLFDTAAVNNIYIEVSPDTLNWLYDPANALSTRYFSARFIFTGAGGLRDTVENTGFRLRGNTSRFAAKKSFKISFSQFVSNRRYQGVKKINLNGEHNDPTLIRESLYYTLWHRAGMVPRRTNFVNVYINRNFYGLYTNLEEMDKDWLTRVYGESGGNLYKCVYPADLVYLGPDQQAYKALGYDSTTGDGAYTLQTNTTASDFTDLVQLCDILNLPADTAFERKIQLVLDVPEFLRAFALDVAAGNWDDYAYNKNNYYLYHHSDGKFRFIAYDCDNTFGVDWIGKDWATRNCQTWQNGSEARPLVSKLLARPYFYRIFNRMLSETTNGTTLPANCFPEIDRMKALIQASVQADTWRTRDYGYTFGSFTTGFTGAVDGHTPYGIKPFLTQRHASTQSQVILTSLLTEDVVGETFVYPNPAIDELMLHRKVSGTKQPVYITDPTGKIHPVTAVEWAGNETVFSLKNLSPGLYFLKSGQSTFTFVKE